MLGGRLIRIIVGRDGRRTARRIPRRRGLWCLPGRIVRGEHLPHGPARDRIDHLHGQRDRAHAHLTQAAARATQLARAAGGYVSSENTALNRAHPDRSTVSLQLKIPVSAYQATLGALSTDLGARLAMSQHAQDVTQTVADVTSRVTSAEAAISQLRSLLRHAGSVSSLLTVQNQINAEESTLESLLARQRALNHETSFGTVTLLLVAPSASHPEQEAPRGGRLHRRPQGRLARPGPLRSTWS